MGRKKGFIHIVIITAILLAIVAFIIYFFLLKNKPHPTSTQTKKESQESPSTGSAQYQNPFDESTNTQYQNPFDQTSQVNNPFDNL